MEKGLWKCVVCGKPATEIHWSIMGLIPYRVCIKHYKTTCSFQDSYRMGLMDVKTYQPVEMKYYGELVK